MYLCTRTLSRNRDNDRPNTAHAIPTGPNQSQGNHSFSNFQSLSTTLTSADTNGKASSINFIAKRYTTQWCPLKELLKCLVAGRVSVPVNFLQSLVGRSTLGVASGFCVTRPSPPSSAEERP
jgi:hypothetical protein